MSLQDQVFGGGQSSFFSDPLICGFLTESLSVFTIHQNAQEEAVKISPAKLIDHSRKYKAIILTWIDKFDLKISNLPKDMSEETAALHYNLLNMKELLRKMFTAWQLFELLFIDVRSKVARMIQLKEWMNTSYSKYENVIQDVLEAEPMHEHEAFWQVIISLILSGQLDHAALLLESHPDSNQELVIIQLLNLLRGYPKLSPTTKHHEHYLHFEAWREKVQEKIRACESVFDNCRLDYIGQIKLMFYLLNGDIEAFKAVSNISSSWYNLMISFLLFTDPCLNQFKLSSLCEEFKKICAEHEDPAEKPFSEMIHKAFDYNIDECILDSCMCFNDNWWFAAHFLDLIHGSQLGDELKNRDIAEFRSTLIRGYAISLYDHPSHLWFLAVEYLQYSPNSKFQVREILRSILSKRKISEREFEQLIHVSKRCNLPDFEQDIYRQRFKRVFQDIPLDGKVSNQLPSGLLWAIKTKDPEFIDAIVDRFLEHYMQTAASDMTRNKNHVGIGELLAPEFVHKLPSTWVGLSDKLGFLFKYYEARKLITEKTYPGAIKILVEMLRFRAVPKYFQLQVMLDIVSIIEFEGIELTQEDIVTVTEAFERLSQQIQQLQAESSDVWATEQDRKQSTETEKTLFLQQFNVLVKYEKIMRIALTHNSSRNFVSASG